MVPMNSMEPEDILMRNQELTLAVARLTDENELLRSTVTDCRIEIERLTAERYRQEVRT